MKGAIYIMTQTSLFVNKDALIIKGALKGIVGKVISADALFLKATLQFEDKTEITLPWEAITQDENALSVQDSEKAFSSNIVVLWEACRVINEQSNLREAVLDELDLSEGAFHETLDKIRQWLNEEIQ